MLIQKKPKDNEYTITKDQPLEMGALILPLMAQLKQKEMKDGDLSEGKTKEN